MVDRIARRKRAGWAVREVDDDEPRIRAKGGEQRIRIECPGVGIQRHQRHGRADRPGDLVQRLIRRPQHRGVIAGGEDCVHGEEDALLGADERDHVFGRCRLVERRDFRSQERVAQRLGIAEPQIVPHRTTGRISEGQKLAERQWLEVRSAQYMAHVELPPREVPLEGEVGYLHLVVRNRRLSHQLGPFRAGLHASHPRQRAQRREASGKLTEIRELLELSESAARDEKDQLSWS